ncbi:MAG: hypothetical protein GY696_01960, partial [Gammaproteobacteria bacterium]|nr:hypothetical protein [Gammaproteobacteria bacterium]
ISYSRAKVIGGIIAALNDSQKSELTAIHTAFYTLFNNYTAAGGSIDSSSWPEATEMDISGLTNRYDFLSTCFFLICAAVSALSLSAIMFNISLRVLSCLVYLGSFSNVFTADFSTISTLSSSFWPNISSRIRRRLPSKRPNCWLFLLLLLCADIQLNPGPATANIDALLPGHLTIASININSLTSKFDELQLFLSTHPGVDVVMIQETKLCKDIGSGELKINGYTLFRHDRPKNGRNGGGVAVYARSSLNPIRLQSRTSIEVLGLKLRCKRKTLSVITAYKPPRLNNDDFVNDLSAYLAALGPDATNRSVVAGDLNICALNKTEFAPLDRMCSVLGYRQLITTPTHLNRAIDLFFSGSHVNVNCTDLLPPMEKNHAIVWARVRAARPPPIQTPPKTIRLWHLTDWSVVRRALAERGLIDTVVTAPDTNTAWSDFALKISTVINEHVPSKVTKGRQKPIINFSNAIQQLFRQKSGAWKRWKATNNPTDLSEFRRLRRLVKKDVQTAKREAVFEAFGNCSGPRDFWRTFNNLSGKRNTDFPTLTNADGSVASDAVEKAEAIASHFDTKWNTQTLDFPIIDPEPLSAEMHCNYTFVEQQLSRLATSKSTGPDNIPAVFLKNCSSVLSAPLSTLFNRSLSEGKVPDDWKFANVSPIPKVSSPETAADYRPIALPSILSKICERHVNHLLWNCM